MSFKRISDQFSIARNTNHFVQVKTLKSARVSDEIWVLLTIDDDKKYARSTAQSIINTLDETFFDHLELASYERFEMTLKEVNLIVASLKEKRGEVGQINCLIAAFSGHELHLAQSGAAEAYLIRNNKFSTITDHLRGKSQDLFVNIASGEMASDDKLIFTTDRLLRFATHNQLAHWMNEGVAEATEAIRDMMMEIEDTSIAIACLHSKIKPKAHNKLQAIQYSDWWEKVVSYAQKAFGFAQKKADELGWVEKTKSISRKNLLWSITIVAVLLTGSIYFLMNSRRESAIRSEYRARLEKLNQDLQVANTRGFSNDKATANAILKKIELEMEDIIEANYFREETIDLMDRIQATRDDINNIIRLKEISPFIDLTTKKIDVNAIGIDQLDDKLYAFEYNTLHEIILDQVLEPKLIDDGEVIIKSTTLRDQNILLFLTQSGRILEFNNGNFSFADTDDQVWQSGVDIAGYGRFLYILSPDDNQIYKYTRLRSNYSSGAAYNNDANLSGAISMAIDGNIYVLKESGEIIKLFKSNAQPFQIDNLAVDLSTTTQIHTLPEHDHLYLLDPTNHRVIIIEKGIGNTARYQKQIVFEDVNDIKEIYVDSDENKLFLLTENAIYREDI